MKSLVLRFWPLLFFGFLVFWFFKSFFFEAKLPIPADTIVGMYHPWRDFYSQEYPQGLPFKNFLITDPVRQQYVWRQLAVDSLKKGQLPLWNPYSFSGTPLLANFQSASFYPLNIFFFILPFNLAWVILVISQPLLAGVFLYLYLRNLKLNQWASLVGGLTFAFSGFSIAWMEWNTILHTGLWLPLILLAIDKIVLSIKDKVLNIKWSCIFIFSLASSFFAGHLQIFFYVACFSLVYLLIRWWQYGKSKKLVTLFATSYLLLTIITAVQWLPTLRFISLSARSVDLGGWQQPGWFIPWQNLVQFLVPDFFGNPATLNYWGVWNYGEFIGYIGVIPLIFCFLAFFYRRDKKTWFFGGTVVVFLLLALPTPLAKLPYQWRFPLLSTSQPTRLLFLIDFSLSILVALGLDWLMKSVGGSLHQRKFLKMIIMVFIIFAGLWIFVLANPSTENLQIAKRNLILPTLLFLMSAVLVYVYAISISHRRIKQLILAAIFVVMVFDLFRFGWKFTPFTSQKWLFPQTKTIDFLQKQPKPFRLMTTDRRIFPPNFAAFYKLEDVAGYDPLYLQDYGELVAAWSRGKPDISPLSFNRILTPQDYNSPIADFLNVKFILSLKDEASPKLKLVFQEGETRIYENIKALPRAFFVERLKTAKDKNDTILKMFTVELGKTAVVEKDDGLDTKDMSLGNVRILSYTLDQVSLETETSREGFLVITDIYYPGWQAEIDGRQTKIYKTDYAFRGIIIPAGEHEVVFKISP